MVTECFVICDHWCLNFLYILNLILFLAEILEILQHSISVPLVTLYDRETFSGPAYVSILPPIALLPLTAEEYAGIQQRTTGRQFISF